MQISVFLHPKHQTVHNQPVSTQKRRQTVQRVTGFQSPCKQMPLQICKHWTCKTKGISEATVMSDRDFSLTCWSEILKHEVSCDNMSPLSNADSYMFGNAIQSNESVKSTWNKIRCTWVC